MRTATTAHLELAIDIGSDPISGSVSNGHGHARRFSGWIDLVAAIEAARSTRAAAEGLGEPSFGVGAKTLGSIPGAKASER